MIEITPQYLAEQGLSENFPERFWDKVFKTELCWYWTAATVNGGYGTISKDSSGKELIRAHRASWILTKGPLPQEIDLCHRCDRPSCVFPDHLFPGTAKDNAHDMIAKGRHGGGAKKGELHFGAKLTSVEVIVIRQKYITGSYSLSQLGEEFDVSMHTIWRIVKRLIWKHL